MFGVSRLVGDVRWREARRLHLLNGVAHTQSDLWVAGGWFVFVGLIPLSVRSTCLSGRISRGETRGVSGAALGTRQASDPLGLASHNFAGSTSLDPGTFKQAKRKGVFLARLPCSQRWSGQDTHKSAGWDIIPRPQSMPVLVGPDTRELTQAPRNRCVETAPYNQREHADTNGCPVSLTYIP